MPISFEDHDSAATGTFDETSVGLDHLALSVADRAELESWCDWLSKHGVPILRDHRDRPGHHLNLRAPDNIAIELFAIKDHVATALGLGQ
jgi:catechol 2,3-dioxygenase-like lactoylglutathione lyase family enzyme